MITRRFQTVLQSVVKDTVEEEYLDTSSFGTELEGDILDEENGVDWRVEVEVEIKEVVCSILLI